MQIILKIIQQTIAQLELNSVSLHQVSPLSATKLIKKCVYQTYARRKKEQI